jgi:hypothetical protein
MGDDTVKAVLDGVTYDRQVLNIGDNLHHLAEYLLRVNEPELAAAVTLRAAGQNVDVGLNALTPAQRARMKAFVNAMGADVGEWDDVVIVTDRARDAIYTGVDSAKMTPGATLMDRVGDAYNAMWDASLHRAQFNGASDPSLWIVADPNLRATTWTRRLRNATSSSSTAKGFAGMRKLGYRLAHTTPDNISLISSDGARELRNWMKLLGATDKLADEWDTAFRKGNAGTRYKIAQDALAAAGEEANNQMLALQMVQWMARDGERHFIRLNGMEASQAMGLGRNSAVTIAHQIQSVPMPNARELLKSVRRYNVAGRQPRWLTRGFGKTEIRRGDIVAKLRKRAEARGIDLSQLGDERMIEDELWRMAYADVLGTNMKGKQTMGGYGNFAYVMNRYVGSAFRGFHNVFTVAQLAGRPIQWTSRVLIEENLRADMFGLPSLFSQPGVWAANMADTYMIARAPKVKAAQARFVDNVVNQVMDQADSLAQIDELLPGVGLGEALAAKGLTIGDHPDKVKAAVSSELVRQLNGLSDMHLSARLSLPREALRNRDRLIKTRRILDDYGLGEKFNWKDDGAAIAQRSAYQSFFKEAESSTHVLEWELGAMSDRSQRLYGYSLGRMTYKHIKDDPIVREYGVGRALAVTSGSAHDFTGARLVTRNRTTWLRIRHKVDEILEARERAGSLPRRMAPRAREWVGPEGGDAETLRSLTNNAEQARRFPEVATVDIDGGRMVIRGSRDTMFGYDEATGEFLGAVRKGYSTSPQMGTVVEHQGRGVNRALRAQIPGYGKNRAANAPLSDQGRAALGLDGRAVPPAAEGYGPMYHGGNLPEDGVLGYYGNSSGNIYGPGLYTTDSESVATSYATGKNRGGAVHSVEWQGEGAPRVLNTEEIADDHVRDVFRSIEESTLLDDVPVESFDAFRATVNDPNSTTADIYRAFRNMQSEGGLTRGVADELHDIVNERIGTQYDAMRYTGGERTGNDPHEAMIWLDPEKVRSSAVPDVPVERPLELSEWSDAMKADWYLENLIDPLTEEMLMGLTDRGDLSARVEILSAWRDRRPYTVKVRDKEFRFDMSANNYDGFTEVYSDYAQAAYLDGRQMPKSVAGYFDPRYGQRRPDRTFTQWARDVADWTLNTFGEVPSQGLHRKPAYLNLHKKYYNTFKEWGYSDEAAQSIATRRAAEDVNYIFFDNKNLPMLLKDMNSYIPFFSAMFEVGSTWAYKIPSVNVLPVGYMNLGRRVQRTIRGLEQSGLIEYDEDKNNWTLTIAQDNPNIGSPLIQGLSNGMLWMMNGPRYFLEMAIGLGAYAWGDGGIRDYGAWTKDGFQIAVGNPLDPTSSGLMAVNQFAASATPFLSLPVATTANAVFALNDERVDTSGLTVGEFFEQNPTIEVEDWSEIYYINEAAFREVNSKEELDKALGNNFDPLELKMPDNIVIPNSAWWETMIDRIFFPFDKIDLLDDRSKGRILGAVVPSSLQHIARGLFAMGDNGEEGVPNPLELGGGLLEFLTGGASQSAIDGEKLAQIQMIEFTTGDVTRVQRIAEEANALIEQHRIQVRQNETTGFREIVPDSLESQPEVAERIQELWDEAAALNADIIRRASNNAAGSAFMRGFMGAFMPATPRMYDRQQQQIAQYWLARDMAEEARKNNYEIDWTQASGITSFEDMARTRQLVAAWLDDESGDKSKAFLRETSPGLLMYAQGKSFWAANGPPVYAEGFDEWQEQQESGARDIFDPEVYIARYWRSGIATDRELAIVNEYGDSPEEQAYEILRDPARYRELVEDFNSSYDAVEFLDTHLFEGKYAAHRAKQLEDLSVYEELESRNRMTRREANVIQEMIEGRNLPPDEERRLVGLLSSVVAAEAEALDDYRSFTDDNATYRNPRERLLDEYYQKVKNPYRRQISEKLAQGLEPGRSSAEYSAMWENIRDINDTWFRQPYDVGGIPVPSPQEHSWRSLSEEDRQNRVLSNLAKRPEWLSEFEIEQIKLAAPDAEKLLPNKVSRPLYRAATQIKRDILNSYLATGNSFKQSELEKALGEVDDRLNEELVKAGRGAEVKFRDAVPLVQLDMLGLLPPELRDMMPVVNQVLAELELNEKSPRTNAGYRAMREVKDWIVLKYFPQHSTAEAKLLGIATAMFEETSLDGTFARMLQGERFGGLSSSVDYDPNAERFIEDDQSELWFEEE